MAYGDEEVGDRWQRIRAELEATAEGGEHPWLDETEIHSVLMEAYESGIDASLIIACSEACANVGEFRERLTSITERTTPWKILAVDDEEGFLDLLKLNLERRSRYEVKALSDPGMALAMIDQFEPDLVILDIVMPGMDGLELVNAIREGRSASELPVIMLTALLDGGVAQAVTRDGLLHLSKPASTKDLMHCINKHLACLPIQASA